MILVNCLRRVHFSSVIKLEDAYWEKCCLRRMEYFPQLMEKMSKLKVLIIKNYGFHPSELKVFELL